MTRGLLLDVLATGDDDEVDAAMACFSELLVEHLSDSESRRTLAVQQERTGQT